MKNDFVIFEGLECYSKATHMSVTKPMLIRSSRIENVHNHTLLNLAIVFEQEPC